MEAILCRPEVSSSLALSEPAEGMAWDGTAPLLEPVAEHMELRLCANMSSLMPSGGDFAFVDVSE